MDEKLLIESVRNILCENEYDSKKNKTLCLEQIFEHIDETRDSCLLMVQLFDELMKLEFFRFQLVLNWIMLSEDLHLVLDSKMLCDNEFERFLLDRLNSTFNNFSFYILDRNLGVNLNYKHVNDLKIIDFLSYVSVSGCQSLLDLDFLSSSSNLIKLSLGHCNNLQSFKRLPSGLLELNLTFCLNKNLEYDFSYLHKLESLDLHECHMTNKKMILPDSLKSVVMVHCRGFNRLPFESACLESIYFRGCGDLQSLNGVQNLTNLKFLIIDNSIHFRSLSELPSSLTRLEILYCESLEVLPDLRSLSKLVVLKIQQCSNLRKIEGLPSSLVNVTVDFESRDKLDDDSFALLESFDLY